MSGSADRPSSSWLRLALPLLVLACVLLVGFGYTARRLSQVQRAEEGRPLAHGALRLAGLEQTIEIWRDGRGIAHVEAQSEADAWFGLGLAQAQDRLSQMLWLRALAEGRAAEHAGADYLPHDRLVRTLGIPRLAAAQQAALPATTRAVLESFSRGINARIERVRQGQGALPEGWASEEIQDWTPSDSLALMKWLAWNTGGSLETPLVLSDMIERLGSVAARPFFPTGTGVRGAALAMEVPDGVSGGGASAALSTPANEGLRALTRPALAGSAFVLSGAQTESGSPVLAVDYHLPPTAPSLLYESQVRARGGAASLDIAGVGVPGIPVFFAGRNPDVAWAATPARVATTGLYRETLGGLDDSGELTKVKTGSRWVLLDRREEEIAVRGGEPESLIVRETPHGPLVNSLMPESAAAQGREPLALAWAGSEPGDGITPFLEVGRANTAEQVVAALADHHEPTVAVIYADRAGNYGLQIAGWVPHRSMPSGGVPVPGAMPLFDWRESLEFGSLPSWHVKAQAPASPAAPGSGPRAPSAAEVLSGSRLDGVTGLDRSWVLAADNPLQPALEATGIEWLWRTGRRARRLEALLQRVTEAGPVSLRDAGAVYADATSPSALGIVVRIRELAGPEEELGREEIEILDLLEQWDASLGVDSRGAAVFQVLQAQLLRELFAAALGDELFDRYLALPHADPFALVERVIEVAADVGEPGGWSDPARVRGALRVSLRRTSRALSSQLGPSRERWVWGRLHELRFRPFMPSALSGLALANGEGLPVPGSETTGALAGYGTASGQSFSVDRAATYRLLMDLAAPDRTLSLLAPGQSEHPGDPRSVDGVARFARGRPALFATSRFLVEEVSPQRLVVEPIP